MRSGESQLAAGIDKVLLDEAKLVRKYNGERYYSFRLSGLERRLELRELRNDTGHWIASNHSIIFGDIVFLDKVAESISRRLAGRPEILLTAESKSILLAGKVAEKLGHRKFEVCRKTLKAYNKDVLSTEIESTISRGEKLFLDSTSVEALAGKKVGLVDDVVTTGGNMMGMERLVRKAGGEVAVKACVWVEGVPLSRKALEARRGLVFLSTLPEYFSERRLESVRQRFRALFGKQDQMFKE